MFRPYNLSDRITNMTICAGKGRAHTCEGDSGGALACPKKQNGRYYLIGVVAWTMRCGSQQWHRFPSGHELVWGNLKWIYEITYKYG